jgi:hypothetical protein
MTEMNRFSKMTKMNLQQEMDKVRARAPETVAFHGTAAGGGVRRAEQRTPARG